ncbi:MAG: hypothetical protein ACFFFH_04965 [Candidatus Thorarchaeota archaeon]
MLLQLTPYQEILSRWSKKSAVPLHISFLDDLLGGLLPYHLQMVLGDSGSGKTWFCLNATYHLLEKEPNAEVLYTDFGGNFRIKCLEKLLSNPHEQLNQITIFQPKSLIEQIIFFRNLLEKSECFYDLIILDSTFGPPLACLEYFHQKSKFWNKKIFMHLLDLQVIARQAGIPILLTNHLFSLRVNPGLESSLNQYGSELIEQFAPIEFLIEKNEQKHILEIRVYQKIIVKSDFELLPVLNNI